MSELEESIKILVQNYGKKKSDIKLEKYMAIIEKYKNTYEFFNILYKQFRPSYLEIDSVGAYLWGCDQKFYGDSNKICSPLCIGNIKHDTNTNLQNSLDYNNMCAYQIWTYLENRLKCIQKVSTFKAYIYVDKNWNGFKEEDLQILKDNEISHVVILTTENSIHKIIFPISSIEKLPIIKFWDKNNIDEYEEKKTETNKYLIYLTICLIIISFLGFRRIYF